MSGHVFQLVSDLFLRHINAFLRSDAVHDEFGFHVVLRALFLALPQRHPVHVYRTRIDALRRQRAHHTFQSRIHLMLHQRFRYGEVVQLDDLRQNLFVEQFLVLVVPLMLQPLANLFLQFVEGGRVADIFREIII